MLFIHSHYFLISCMCCPRTEKSKYCKEANHPPGCNKKFGVFHFMIFKQVGDMPPHIYGKLPHSACNVPCVNVFHILWHMLRISLHILSGDVPHVQNPCLNMKRQSGKFLHSRCSTLHILPAFVRPFLRSRRWNNECIQKYIHSAYRLVLCNFRVP